MEKTAKDRLVTPREKIRTEAAFWVERMNRPVFDAQDGAAFDQWMRRNPENREAFAAMAAMWDEDFPRSEDVTGATAPDDPHPASGRRWFGRRSWSAVAMVAASAVAAMVLVPPMLPRSYVSAPGEQKAVQLADGSVVQLGGNSAVHVQYLPWRRTVRLARGEAGFDVSHDRRRPFDVQAGDTDIVVLGTAFHVDRLADERVGVQVVRGAVQVSTDDADERLTAGQAVRVTAHGIQRVAMQDEDSQWGSGWFVASNIPLADLIEKVRRNSGDAITIVDEEAANIMIVGRFNVSDPEAVLQGVSTSYNIDVSRRSDGIYISTSN